MIKDNGLSNRLNAVKKGKQIPVPINEEKPVIGTPIPTTVVNKEPQEYEETTPKLWIFFEGILNLSELTIMSFLYGFGVKTLLSQSWGFLGIIGVGLLVNQVLSILANSKLFK